MRTISLKGPESLSVIDQGIDKSSTTMAVLRVISSGICAADSYLWFGNHPWDISYPIVPGHEIFGEVIEKVGTRPGGYTRIIKTGFRLGDNAEMCIIELVDFNEIYGNSVNAAAEPAKKTRRSRATTKKADVAEAEVVAETPAVEPTADSSTDKAAE